MGATSTPKSRSRMLSRLLAGKSTIVGKIAKLTEYFSRQTRNDLSLDNCWTECETALPDHSRAADRFSDIAELLDAGCRLSGIRRNVRS
jgi:hypothetical protein